MSQLTFASAPIFNDLADASIGTDKALTDDAIQKISKNAKFGIVRPEIIFLGYYKNGDTVPTPVSPVDAYAYSTAEVVFDFQLYSTRAPASGFFSGQSTPPAIGVSQPGNLFWFTANINSAGVVALTVSYLKNSSETQTNDGIVKVYALCQRNAALALGAQPSFLDVPDDVLAVSQPLRVGNAANKFGLQDISHNAKYGAVRHEIIFQGFFSGSQTIGLPTSPVDGYTYKRGEIRYKAILYTTLAPNGTFANGQTTVPTLGNGQLAKRTGKGPMYWYKMDVEDTTGVTACGVSYYVEGGAESIYDGSAPLSSADGILKVYAICQRDSVNSVVVGVGGSTGSQGGVGGIGPADSINTNVPDAPVLAVVYKNADGSSSRYHVLVGVDAPASPSNWNGIYSADLQITPDPTFATFPAGQSLNKTYGASVLGVNPIPFTETFETNFPQTYYIRARVTSGYGPSAWQSITLTTDVLDNLTDDTGLIAGVTPSLAVKASNSDALSGNEIAVSFEVPTANAATYYGFQIIAHDSGTLPAVTKDDTGTAGQVTSGVPELVDLTKAWTPGSKVGKWVIAFDATRGGSPTYEFEGQIIQAKITANTSTKLTFDARYQNLARTRTGLTYFIVNDGNLFWQIVKYASPVYVDPSLTNIFALNGGRSRTVIISPSFQPAYVWVILFNSFGSGKVTATPPNATYAGIFTNEIKDAAIATAKIVGTGAGTGAVTAAKTNIVNLGDITLNLGTVQTGLMRTASSGARIEIDSTNGVRAFDSGGTVRAQMAVSGGQAGNVTSFIFYGTTSTTRLSNTNDTCFLDISTTTHSFKVGSVQVAVINSVGFAGDGSQITGLDATNIASGSLADARLSSNVVLKNITNNISGKLDFNAGGGQLVPRHFSSRANFKAGVIANEIVTFADSGVFYIGSFDSSTYFEVALSISP